MPLPLPCVGTDRHECHWKESSTKGLVGLIVLRMREDPSHPRPLAESILSIAEGLGVTMPGHSQVRDRCPGARESKA